MLQFDEEKALKKHMRETGHTEILAVPEIQALKNIDERLHPCVIAWLNDEAPVFKFHDVTLELILEKERGNYIDAIHSMDFILSSDDPIEEAEFYLTIDFRRK